MRYKFTEKIIETITNRFGKIGEQVFDSSELLKYINYKTQSADRGSKSRSSFGNLYAIYVIVEDYIAKGFHKRGNYGKYEGARFSDLFKRQRELPFGEKLQNHALNHRMNQEFKKLFPTSDFIPIIREIESKRYWINTNLLKVRIGRRIFNIAEVLIEIIDAYIESKQRAFRDFVKICEDFKNIETAKNKDASEFICSLLAPNIDARIFEIVSYAILKASYGEQSVYWGFSQETVSEEKLKLFKTGRTNANDGGIDFVMKPLGRFFQVTETTDVKKYFLDIDKLEKYPITFVIKSEREPEFLWQKIRDGAEKQYSIEAVVNKYMNCIEEIITINKLKEELRNLEKNGKLSDVLGEILIQSKIEFNFSD